MSNALTELAGAMSKANSPKSDLDQPITRLGKVVNQIVNNPRTKFYGIGEINFSEWKQTDKSSEDVFCSDGGMVETEITCRYEVDLSGVSIKTVFKFPIRKDDRSVFEALVMTNNLNELALGTASFDLQIPILDEEHQTKEYTLALLKVRSFGNFVPYDLSIEDERIIRKFMDLHYRFCKDVVESIEGLNMKKDKK